MLTKAEDEIHLEKGSRIQHLNLINYELSELSQKIFSYFIEFLFMEFKQLFHNRWYECYMRAR